MGCGFVSPLGDIGVFTICFSLATNAIYTAVTCLLLIPFNAGATYQRVFSLVGDDVILPRQLDPPTDVSDLILDWSRAGVSPVVHVHVYRHRSELVDMKDPAYAGRTYLFREELKRGNVSLKLHRVRLSDEGDYRCYIPSLGKESHIQLVVGAAPSPDVLLVGKNEEANGVVLQCDSKGWYPQPELSWLDGEGQLLPAGPPETVRTDGLYTVRRNVTVKKTDRNTFTCRVQQHNISQTREKAIHIPEEFFSVNSGWTPGIAGVLVALLVGLGLGSLLALLVIKKRSDLLGLLGRRAQSNGRTEVRQQEDGL